MAEPDPAMRGDAACLPRFSTWRWCAWLGATLLLVLVLSRAWTFMPQVPRFHAIGHDAAWFWDLQAQVERGTTAPSTEYQRARLALRSNADLIVTRAVVYLSHVTGWDRWRVNLVLTTLVFLLAAGLTFILAAELLGSLAWAMPATVLLSQSVAFSWLDYQVLVPKMLGFVLFPLLLLALLRYARGTSGAQGHRVCAGLLAILSVIYGPTALYLLPVIMPILGWLVWRAVPARDRRRSLAELACVGVVCLLLIRLVSGGTAAAHPPPLAVADFFYSNHYLAKAWRVYVRDFLDLIVLGCGALCLFVVLRRRGNESSSGALLLAVGGGCLFLGLLAHALALHVDLFRMTWLWRMTYYAHLPLLLFVLYIGVTSVRQTRPGLRRFGFVILAGCATCVLWPGSRNALAWHPVMNTVVSSISGKVDDHYSECLAPLVRFAQQTPANSVFLLPPPRLQGVELAHLFEAESGRGVALSASEKYLMIVEMPLTLPYHTELLALTDAYRSGNGPDLIARLRLIAARIGATHIVVPAGSAGQALPAPAWRDDHWVVFTTLEP